MKNQGHGWEELWDFGLREQTCERWQETEKAKSTFGLNIDWEKG